MKIHIRTKSFSQEDSDDDDWWEAEPCQHWQVQCEVDSICPNNFQDLKMEKLAAEDVNIDWLVVPV